MEDDAEYLVDEAREHIDEMVDKLKMIRSAMKEGGVSLVEVIPMRSMPCHKRLIPPWKEEEMMEQDDGR